MSGTLIVSIFALVVSGFALNNSFKQRKIANEAHRLSLYQRRFSILEESLRLYTGFISYDEAELKQALFAYAVTVNEARYLFNPKDGIAELMEGFSSKFLARDGRKDSIDFPGMEFDLDELRRKLDPYLNFQRISVN